MQTASQRVFRKNCLTYCREEEHKYFKINTKWNSGAIATDGISSIYADCNSLSLNLGILFSLCSQENHWKKKRKKKKSNNTDFIELCLCLFQAFRTNIPEWETLLFMNASQTSQNTSFNTDCSPPPHRGAKSPHLVQQHLNICIPKHSNFLLLSQLLFLLMLNIIRCNCRFAVSSQQI